MLVNFKAFLGSTIAFAVIGTILSVVVGVPAPVFVIFLNGLFLGAIINGIAWMVNTIILKSTGTNFKSLAISTSIAAALIYILFSFNGMNAISIIGLVVTVVYAVVAAFAGSACARIK